MQFRDPDVGRDSRWAPRGGQRASEGWGIASGALLVMLGFLIAVLAGVMTGIVSPDRVTALFGGTDTAASTPPAAAAAAAEVAAPAATETPGQRASGQANVLREQTFGDWRFFCLEGGAGAAPICSVVQQLRVAETGAAVFVWRMVQDGKGGLVGLWQVPETVQRSAGLTLDAGTPKPLIIPFESCGGGSCQVIANLAPDFVAALAGAETLVATVMLDNQQTLKFPLSANGLRAALAELQK